MISKRFLSIAIVVAAIAAPLSAKLNLPTKKLGKETFYYYEVKKNETIFDIAKKIGVSRDDIVKYNPQAINGVVKKQLLFLPVKNFDAEQQPTSGNDVNLARFDSTTKHYVKSGESVYGIAKAYNVTEKDLLAVNPSMSGGVKEGDVINIPNKLVSSNQGQYIFHTLTAGESLFSIAKKYNTTIEQLVELNPGISGNNLVENDVIRIVPNTPKSVIVDKDYDQIVAYVVKNNDTYESVAAAYGLPVEQLKSANPDQKKLKKGKTIYIPRKAVDQTVVNTAAMTEKQLEEAYKGKLNDIYSQVIAPNKNGSIDISIILPFQAGMKEQTRNASNYLEFFNGFVLALDSLDAKLPPINLNVYDTKHSLDTTDSILRIEDLKLSDLIIAPSEPKQMERIMNYGKTNNINILNCFATQNDDYISNNRVMQVNIPTPYLNARINEFLDEKFKDYVLVYLEDPQVENKDIYDDIKKHASQVKHQNKTITVASELTGKTLSKYLEPGSSYIFIPANGKESLLKKFAAGLSDAKKTRVDCDIVLLGHPEYTMYMKGYKNTLMDIDTYIYSRFYLSDDKNVEEFNRKYVDKYNVKPANSTPNMSVFGYDVAKFIVNAFAKGKIPGQKGSEYNGIQTNFDFERANNWAGYINKSVKIIHLTPKKELIIEDLND